MADSTRPPAPFLPPEIISRIVLFFHPKRFGYDGPNLVSLSRVSSAWTVEVQRRLFESITIQSSTKLLKLVLALGSAPQLGRFILSLWIDNLKATNPVNDALLVFHLLSSVPNLTDFTFLNPSFDSFSQENSTAMQLVPPLLPKLTTLHLDAGQDKAWKREVFDEILINAPNITELSLEGNGVYQGPMWRSHIPAKLKKLTTGREAAVLEGKIWPIASQGLESLTVDHIQAVDGRDSFLPFFEAVGPTLVEMHCIGWQAESHLLAEIHPFLTVLEQLTLSTLPVDNSSPRKLLLPETLTSLVIEDWDDDVNILGAPLPCEAWSHLTQLETVRFERMSESFDLSQLEVKKLSIRYCHGILLLESMKNLEIGSTAIGKFELSEIHDTDEEDEIVWDYDGARVRKRCEELGIDFTLHIY